MGGSNTSHLAQLWCRKVIHYGSTKLLDTSIMPSLPLNFAFSSHQKETAKAMSFICDVLTRAH
jgi:hypothetical protein